MMTNRSQYPRQIGLAALLALSFLISACGGGGGGSASTVSGGSNDVVSGNFSGSIIDGPVVGATVKFYDRDKNLIQTVTSDVYANYSTSIKAKGNAYPLTIEVEDGTDLVTGRAVDFKLISFVPHPTKKKINITPFTTLIVETARSMPGGVSDDNIAAATAVVMDKFNFGSDPDFVTDPFGTGFTDENVAITLLSSEAMGEMLRRVRDRLRASGVVANADDVIGALADDLADGVIDGVGGSRAQGRITAMIRLVSAQVLIEALSNNLMVDGARAADKLDAAIAVMRPSAPASAMMEFVQINSEMLLQVRTDVAAARALAPSVELTTIANTLDTIQAGSLPSDIEPVLPVGSSADLDPAIELALVASDEQLDAVNNVGGSEPVNSTPLLTGTAASFALEDSDYLFQPVATDADGDVLTFTILNRPGWAVFNRDTGRFSGTPNNNDVGIYSDITITVSDSAASTSIDPFSITVNNTNDAPGISGNAPTSANAGVHYSFQPSASDVDGDDLAFSIQNRPSWASFNTGTGRLSGTPADSHVGSHSNIVISVTDGTDTVSLKAFSIQVAAEGESTRVTANLVSLYPFTERSGNVVRDLSGSASPMDLTISGSVDWYGAGNGVVMNGGRVGTEGPATELINALRASNASSFEIWVQPANITQTGPTRMISIGSDASSQNFMLGQVGDDVEARLLHTGKGSDGKPRLNTSNGVLGTSLVHLVHTYDGSVERLYINGVQHSQTVAMSGGYGNWDVSDLFNIGNEGSSNRPYNGIIHLVAVYDRALITAEIQQNFAAGPTAGGVDGGGANYVPVISGTPAGKVITDERYDFQPKASDVDGDALVFSIDGKPAWANFDTTTGRLSGSPTSSDIGTYSNIVISVSDGADTASLGTFSIQVSEFVEMGSFTLSWTAPAARSDGTPLSLADIAGYRVYYSESPGSYLNSVAVTDSSATSITVTDIPVGTYYMVMTTNDSGGRESGYSPEILKTVQ